MGSLAAEAPAPTDAEGPPNHLNAPHNSDRLARRSYAALSMGTSMHLHGKIKAKEKEMKKQDLPFAAELQGSGLLAGLHSELKQLKRDTLASEETIRSLNHKNQKLQRELDSTYQQLKRTLVGYGAMEQALELDQAMSSRDGPVRLSGRMMGEMWSHMNFSVLKKERERRLDEVLEVNKRLQAHEHVMEVRAEMLRNEIRAMEQKFEETMETIDRLRLKKGAVKLLDSLEQQNISQAWNQASGPRPWEPKKTEDAAEVDWTFDVWLEPLELHRVLAEPFELMLQDQGFGIPPAELRSPAGRRAFLHALGTYGSKETVVAMLRSAPLLDTLSTIIWEATVSFKEQCDMLAKGLAKAEAQAQRLRDEKAADDAAGIDPFETIDLDDPSTWGKAQPRLLTYGPPRLFFSSLREAIGGPASDGLVAMAREHTVRADSNLKFNAPNYDITTTSKLEWYIVAEPEKALVELGMDEWTAGGGHTPVDLGFRHVNAPRSEFFQKRIRAAEDRLRKAGDHEPISLEHFCALRMYTGPICASPKLTARRTEPCSACGATLIR